MQENEFERQLRDKMQELQMVPNAEVWAKVLADIQKEKRKRRLLFILLPLVIVALGVGFFLHEGTQKSNSLTNKRRTDTGSIPIAANQKRMTDDKLKNKVNEVVSSSLQVAKNSGVYHNDEAKSEAAKNTKLGRHLSKVENGHTRKQVEQKTANANETRHFSSPLQAVKERLIDKDGLDTKDKQVVLTNEAIETSTSTSQVKTDTSTTKSSGFVKNDSLSKAASSVDAKKKLKERKSEKWKFGITVLAGGSNNHSGFALFPASNANFAYNSSPTASTGTTPSAPGLTYHQSFSYAFGLFATKRLNRRVGISAGLNYYYGSAKSLVGQKATGTQTFYDLASTSSQMVNEYYRAGESTNYLNNYQLIQLPVDLLVQLNSNEKKPFVITAGVSPGYLIASNALYANNSQNAYYQNRQQFRRWQLATQVGLQFTVASKSMFGLSVGPHLQYGITNMTKASTGTNQHLITTGIKANFYLRKHKK